MVRGLLQRRRVRAKVARRPYIDQDVVSRAVRLSEARITEDIRCCDRSSFRRDAASGRPTLFTQPLGLDIRTRGVPNGVLRGLHRLGGAPKTGSPSRVGL